MIWRWIGLTVTVALVFGALLYGWLETRRRKRRAHLESLFWQRRHIYVDNRECFWLRFQDGGEWRFVAAQVGADSLLPPAHSVWAAGIAPQRRGRRTFYKPTLRTVPLSVPIGSHRVFPEWDCEIAQESKAELIPSRRCGESAIEALKRV